MKRNAKNLTLARCKAVRHRLHQSLTSRHHHHHHQHHQSASESTQHTGQLDADVDSRHTQVAHDIDGRTKRPLRDKTPFFVAYFNTFLANIYVISHAFIVSKNSYAA